VKKVRCLIGFAGLAPATLGLAMQAVPAAATTARPANSAPIAGGPQSRVKAVSLRHSGIAPDSPCKGHTPQQRTIHFFSSEITLGFWSTTNGDKTCIGDIWVHGSGAIGYASALVKGQDGRSYCTFYGNLPLEWTCGGSFYRPFSVIAYPDANEKVPDIIRIG
jgi:hypothetical protein